jgi:predicted dehydrogenase
MNLTHHVDFIRFITGVEPAWVSGTARTDAGREVEDAVALAVGFEGGAVGTISGSASTRGVPPNRFELWGEVGALRSSPIRPSTPSARSTASRRGAGWPLPPDAGDDPAPDLRRALRRRGAAGRPPEVTADDGLAVQAFVDAAYRSIDGRVRRPAGRST